MGTRGLTKVWKGGELIVAQYGQWDHYPSGAGVSILRFLSDKDNVEKLRLNSSLCYWIEQSTHEAIVGEFTGQSKNKGWMTLDEDKMFAERYPTLDRDTGPDILSVIANNTDPLPMKNNDDFKDDELMCEGIYTVDLDNNLFISEYSPYPTRAYELDALPTEDEYLATYREEANA
jgi:hypothetical protein